MLAFKSVRYVLRITTVRDGGWTDSGTTSHKWDCNGSMIPQGSMLFVVICEYKLVYGTASIMIYVASFSLTRNFATSSRLLSDFLQRLWNITLDHWVTVMAAPVPDKISVLRFLYQSSFSQLQNPLFHSHAGLFQSSCLGHQEREDVFLLLISVYHN